MSDLEGPVVEALTWVRRVLERPEEVKASEYQARISPSYLEAAVDLPAAMTRVSRQLAP